MEFREAINADGAVSTFCVQVKRRYEWNDYINHSSEAASKEIIKTLRNAENRLPDNKRQFRLVSRKITEDVVNF